MATGDIQIGAVLSGTYQITELLGRGGMGAVWTASHLRLPGKKVAIKVLLATSQSDESYARFRREADIATRIGHPNIVEVLDWNTLPDGTPYLVLEYLAGESLGVRLLQGPMPLETVIDVVRQIGSALYAAHKAGVVHRDLKPDNIFLCPTDSGGHVTDHVKILDFGISKIKNSTTLQTQEARLLGTPQYMAPEQALGKNQLVDQRTDIFALGAIVYEMLSGKPPFAADNLAAVVFKVVYEDPPPLEAILPGVPAHVVAAIKKALAKDRDQRHTDVVAFVGELTGRPLSTLDRKRLSKVEEAFAPTTDAMSLPPHADLAKGTAPAKDSAVAPPPAKKSRAGLIAAVLGAVVVGGGVGAALVLGGGGSAPAAAPDAARVVIAPPPPAAPDAAPVAVAAPDAARVAAVPIPDAAVKLATPTPPPHPNPPSHPNPPPHPNPNPTPPPAPTPSAEPPAEVAEELRSAESALARGDYETAIRLARHSLQTKITPHAYGVITRGYCGLHDLGNAKAALQNVRGVVRTTVMARCRRMGFPLDD